MTGLTRDGGFRLDNMTRVYICSPYSSDTAKGVELNVARATSACTQAIRQGFIPVAPHIYFTQFLDDTSEDQRNLGMFFGLELLRLCKELWIIGDHVSAGMQQEINEARKLGVNIVSKPDPLIVEWSEY